MSAPEKYYNWLTYVIMVLVLVLVIVNVNVNVGVGVGVGGLMLLKTGRYKHMWFSSNTCFCQNAIMIFNLKKTL